MLSTACPEEALAEWLTLSPQPEDSTVLPPSKQSTTRKRANNKSCFLGASCRQHETLPTKSSSAPVFQDRRVGLEAIMSALLARRNRRVGLRVLSSMPACKIKTEYLAHSKKNRIVVNGGVHRW